MNSFYKHRHTHAHGHIHSLIGFLYESRSEGIKTKYISQKDNIVIRTNASLKHIRPKGQHCRKNTKYDRRKNYNAFPDDDRPVGQQPVGLQQVSLLVSVQ